MGAASRRAIGDLWITISFQEGGGCWPGPERVEVIGHTLIPRPPNHDVDRYPGHPCRASFKPARTTVDCCLCYRVFASL